MIQAEDQFLRFNDLYDLTRYSPHSYKVKKDDRSWAKDAEDMVR